MLRLNTMDYIAHLLVIVGAINWGLVGFFNYDLVGALFGGAASVISRCLFALVGLAGLYVISFFFRNNRSHQAA